MKFTTLALSALLATAGAAGAEVKIALDTAPDLATSGSYNWAHAFAEALAAAGMEPRELPRGAIGNETEIFDQITTGLLEVSLSDVRSVAQVAPYIYGVRLPYLFDDAAHLDRALAEGDVFAQTNGVAADHAFRVVALVPLGPSSGIITTDRAVRSPEDMAGLRMRALDEAQIALYESWGASGAIVPWGEVPAALQTGVIDGYLNSPLVPIMFGQTDIVHHFTDAGVIIPLRAVLFSADWYDGLSDEDRAAVDAAVDAGNAANRAWLEATAGSALTDLEAAGVSVERLGAEERAAFRARSEQTYDSGLMPAEDLARWIDIAARTR